MRRAMLMAEGAGAALDTDDELLDDFLLIATQVRRLGMSGAMAECNACHRLSLSAQMLCHLQFDCPAPHRLKLSASAVTVSPGCHEAPAALQDAPGFGSASAPAPACASSTSRAAMLKNPSAASDGPWEEASSDSEASSADVTDIQSLGSASRPRGSGSIASTYWRPERADRNEQLSAIDER